VHALAVVRGEPEVERGERGERPGDADRLGDACAHVVGHVLGEQ